MWKPQKYKYKNYLKYIIFVVQAENYQALIDSESEEEKQNEESKKDTQISENNLPQAIHNIINTTVNICYI